MPRVPAQLSQTDRQVALQIICEQQRVEPEWLQYTCPSVVCNEKSTSHRRVLKEHSRSLNRLWSGSALKIKTLIIRKTVTRLIFIVVLASMVFGS